MPTVAAGRVDPLRSRVGGEVNPPRTNLAYRRRVEVALIVDSLLKDQTPVHGAYGWLTDAYECVRMDEDAYEGMPSNKY